MARTAEEQAELDLLVAFVRNDAQGVFRSADYPTGMPVAVIGLVARRVLELKAKGGDAL